MKAYYHAVFAILLKYVAVKLKVKYNIHRLKLFIIIVKGLLRKVNNTDRIKSAESRVLSL